MLRKCSLRHGYGFNLGRTSEKLKVSANTNVVLNSFSGKRGWGQMETQSLKRWGMIPYVGKPFPTMTTHFPRWETISRNGTSSLPRHQTPIHKGIEGGWRRPPLWMGVWLVGKEKIPPWGMVSYRGKFFVTVENGFAQCEIISHLLHD